MTFYIFDLVKAIIIVRISFYCGLLKRNQCKTKFLRLWLFVKTIGMLVRTCVVIKKNLTIRKFKF